MAREIKGVGTLRLQPKVWHSNDGTALLTIGCCQKDEGSFIVMKLVPEAEVSPRRIEEILNAANKLQRMPHIIASRENPRSRKGEWELCFLFPQRPQEMDVENCLDRAAELLSNALEQLG